MPLQISLDDVDKMLHAGALVPHAALTPAEPVPEQPAAAPSSLPGDTPALAKPTPQQSIATGMTQNGDTAKQEGKRQFQAGMPQVEAQPLTPGFYREKEAQNEYSKDHPWGSPISAQPGFAGKVGHALATAGNIAGDIFAPGTTALIPGSQLNRDMQSKQNAENEEKAQTVETQKESVEQKPELAEAEGELRGQQKAQDEAAQDKRTQEQIAASEKNNEDTNATRLTAAQMAEGDKPPKTVEMGNRTFQYDEPTKSWKDIGAAKAPPSEPGSYLPVPDAAGNTVGWVDPKTKHFVHVSDITGAGQASGGGNVIPMKPTGQTGSRMQQAQAVIRAGDGLIQDIGTHKENLGNMDAILKSAFLNTPLSNPDEKYIATEIASFAALQPAMHGFRGGQALEEFKNMIGGVPTNPDALVQSIKAIQKTAGALEPASGGGPAPNQVTSGVTHKWNTQTGKIEPVGIP